jgi:2-polyprenyl-3-methyl-5-hydroxy-6-metoxy-1,4-benzoquinol methylase
MSSMVFDERLIINEDSQTNIIYDEHLVRYQLAASLVKGNRVLDIACGSGYGTKILSKAGAAEVIGIDADEMAVKEAEKNYGGEAIVFKTGDAENIKENNESFDIIISFETIEHLKNPEKYLAEISRILKKDGIALVSTPNKEVFGQKNPYHLHEFQRTEFEVILKKYFVNVSILEQVNGIASLIKGEKAGKIDFFGSDSPLYFIAVCTKSNIVLPEAIGKSFVSVNPAALERMRNNPAVKLVDKIYSFMSFLRRRESMKGVKKS